MTPRGRMIYVPKNVLVEAEKIMQSKKIKRVDALNDLVKYARVGREAERIYKFDFKHLFGGKK
jgi:hypothetical protein